MACSANQLRRLANVRQRPNKRLKLAARVD